MRRATKAVPGAQRERGRHERQPVDAIAAEYPQTESKTDEYRVRKTPEQRSTSALARRIIEQLKDLPVRRILLFGSRVWGDPHPDSDLDILVVLKGTEEPRTSSEKGALYRRVSRPLRDLQREWPVDLLVHTEGMHRRFRERGGTFARKVLKDGEVIYEDGG